MSEWARASERASERLLVERLTPDTGHRKSEIGHRTLDTRAPSTPSSSRSSIPTCESSKSSWLMSASAEKSFTSPPRNTIRFDMSRPNGSPAMSCVRGGSNGCAFAIILERRARTMRGIAERWAGALGVVMAAMDG